jgi:hypothetical protein
MSHHLFCLVDTLINEHTNHIVSGLECALTRATEPRDSPKIYSKKSITKLGARPYSENENPSMFHLGKAAKARPPPEDKNQKKGRSGPV